MKKKLVSIILAFVLVFSFCSTSFGAVIEEDIISPLHTNHVVFTIDRTSATTADVNVDVHFSTVVDQYNVVIYLQKLVNGTWSIDSSNSERILYNNGWNSDALYFFNEYTGLDRTASYRIKVISKDYINGTPYTETIYSSAF